MVNYYHDMWIQRSEILTPLMRLISANVKFKWTSVEQMAFDKIKQIVGCETLLSSPDFNLPFEIHTDASHTQLGVVISQNNKPIAFYSRKRQLAQRQYTTTEHELLSIIETQRVQKHPSGTMMINGIVIGVGLYARAIPYTSPRLLPRK